MLDHWWFSADRCGIISSTDCIPFFWVFVSVLMTVFAFGILYTACFPIFDEQKANTFVENRDHDYDKDGFTEEDGDCDDSNSFIYPGSAEFDPEVCGPDKDGDGYADIEAGGRDCNDSSNEQYPAATEICDGLDNDCNGVVDDQPIDIQEWYEDADGDGFGIENSRFWPVSSASPTAMSKPSFGMMRSPLTVMTPVRM